MRSAEDSDASERLLIIDRVTSGGGSDGAASWPGTVVSRNESFARPGLRSLAVPGAGDAPAAAFAATRAPPPSALKSSPPSWCDSSMDEFSARSPLMLRSCSSAWPPARASAVLLLALRRSSVMCSRRLALRLWPTWCTCSDCINMMLSTICDGDAGSSSDPPGYAACASCGTNSPGGASL